MTRNGERFYLDGEPFTIRSGAIHYFRVPRPYWRDRLLKLKECGFNTVETYVAWNVHESHEGDFDFSGEKDVAAFLRTAQELGLYAIVRPGPFICAEWEAGGFPAWLLADRNMRLRCNCAPYMQKVERYFKRLFAELSPCAIENGGNVILWQVENEYGSYGNDKEYLRRLVEIYRENGIAGQLFTADGAWINMLVKGALPETCLPFVTFGSRTEEAMRCVDLFVKNTPKMCAEFWCGWFDHWGEEHHTRTSEDVLKDLEPFFIHGWSFNFYMFHGGTNFGFMNGANSGEKYMPTVTSYDYCGLLTEAGDRTETYYKVRDMFIKYGVNVPALTAKESKKAAYGKVRFTERAYLFEQLDALSKPITSTYPPYMEEIGQNYGYILYSTVVPKGLEEDRLFLDNVADRALVYLDGKRIATVDRNEPAEVLFDTEDGDRRLDILVENRGRINYGTDIGDRKGLESVRLSSAKLFGWTVYPLEMHDLSGLRLEESNNKATDMPVFCTGAFSVDEPCDAFVEIAGAERGFITVNGFNLGRFNNTQGPQKTLYVPAPYLKEGENAVMIFSSDGADENVSAVFSDTPKL